MMRAITRYRYRFSTMFGRIFSTNTWLTATKRAQTVMTQTTTFQKPLKFLYLDGF